MARLWTPREDREYARPWCAVCGLPPTHPKFGGSVVVANRPAQCGCKEVIFCKTCSTTEEAQDVYVEAMLSV